MVEKEESPRVLCDNWKENFNNQLALLYMIEYWADQIQDKNKLTVSQIKKL